MSTIPSADLVGLQYGLVTSEDALTWADGNELSDLSNNVKKNQQAFNTVTSPVLGTLNANTLCGRCGGSLEQCNGHCAIIKLFEPIFNVNFFPVLPKTLSCLCVRCGRLLLPDDHPRLVRAKKASNFKRAVNEVSALTAKYRVCWFPSNIMTAKKKKPAYKKKDEQTTTDKQPQNEDEEQPHVLSTEEAKRRGYCGVPQPQFFRDEDILIRPAYYISHEDDFQYLPKITPRHMYNMLKFASPKAMKILGFDPTFSPLHAMMCENLLVPPLIIRPLRSSSEDDLTMSLRKIQEANTAARHAPRKLLNLTVGLIRTTENMHFTPTVARKKMVRVQEPMTTTLMRKKVPIIPACLDEYFLVQRACATLWDSKYHRLLDQEYGRDRFSLKKRFAPGKRSKGRVRQSLLGKRGDFTARGAATPNTKNDLDEVGVPKTACMHLSWPENVNSLNYNFLLGLVQNGQDVYPGCNYVERDGTLYLPSANFGGLRIGDIVHRHLRKGDWVIINRQPSLHKFAIMGYRIVVSPDSTFDSHLGITTVLGLDFDGDEENMYCPQSLLESAEIAHLMSVRQNLMKDGKLAIGFVQHSVLGAYKLTEIHPVDGPVILEPDVIQQYLAIGRNEKCICDALLKWYEYNQHQPLTGREFMHIILPTYNPSNPKPLDKSTLNECMGATIEQTGDMDFAADRISFLTRILEMFCSECGCSLSIDDCLVAKPPPDIQKQADDIFKDACDIAQELEACKNGQQEAQADAEEAEEDVCTLTGMYRDVLGKYAIEQQKNDRKSRACGMLDTVVSRSKGTEANITQNVIVVGQQVDGDSLRYKDSTSHYYKNVLARYGFIERSFLDGLTPTEFFFHLRAARVGLISTACQTSDSGYLYRKLFKSVEDERISFDNSVRNAVGQIIVFEYGFETTFLHSVLLCTVAMTLREIADTFCTVLDDDNEDDDPCSIDEVQHLITIRNDVIENDPRTHISIPVHFDKKFTCSHKHCAKHAVSYNAARNQVAQLWIHLVTNCRMMPSPIYELMFFENMATRVLFDAGHLQCAHVFKSFMAYVEETLGTNVAVAGDAVGMAASQSCTQPLTQTGLKRFHLSGEKCTVVNGVSRLREIINLVKSIERPVMYVFLLPGFEDTFDPMELVELRLAHVVQKFSDKPFDQNAEETYGLIYLTLYLHKSTMEKRMLSPRAICAYLENTLIIQSDATSVTMTYAQLLDETWWLTITLPRTSKILVALVPLQEDVLVLPAPLLSLKLQHALIYDKQLLAGIEGVRDFAIIEKEILIRDEENDERLFLRKRKAILTLGSNLQAVCALEGVDLEHTISNDIRQMYNVYGIDSCMQSIEENLIEAMQVSETSVLRQHIHLIAATMCFTGQPVSLTFSGMSTSGESSWFKRALFEQALSSFIGCGVFSHTDSLRGISEAIVTGTTVSVGCGGDFRMHPNEAHDVPEQPTPPPFVFTVPDIRNLLKPPVSESCKREISDDGIRLNLDTLENDDASLLSPRDKKRARNDNSKGNASKRMATASCAPITYAYGRKDEPNVLRSSSPVASSRTLQYNPYGSSGILLSSSPKKRKKNERRKPKKSDRVQKRIEEDGDLLLNSSNMQSLLDHFFDPTNTTMVSAAEYDGFFPSSP